MRLHSVASGLHGRPGKCLATTAASLGREAILNDTRTLDESKTREASEILTRRRDLAFAGAPFLGGDFPDFRGEAAGNIVTVFDSDEAHALLFGDTPRGGVADGFGCAQDGEAKRVEPEIGDGFARFGHEPLVLPSRAEPEAAIVIFFFAEVDAADDLAWSGFQAEGPVPGFGSLYCGKRQIANKVKCPVSRIGPGHLCCQVAYDFPMREDNLNLFSICELEWAQ